jgi:hypothetical protein
MESLSPNIFVESMSGTIRFYESIGFKLVMTVPEDGNDFVWAMMTNGAVTFMFQTFESLGEALPQISRNKGGSLLFYVNLKNIRQFFEDVKDKVTILKGLEKAFYGPTEFSILDNNNYVLTFAEDESA